MGINQGPISLDQKYTQGTGHIFLTGIQALVRLPMAQIRRDRAAGLNTAGFVTGYRGSPLGGYDQQLFAARKHLDQYNIKFQPGVNEDLAATAMTPPNSVVPAMLACLKTSEQRSTPGPLPYQMPTTPSYLAPGERLSCCEPQTAVADRSSFTPGWNLMLYWSRCFRAAKSCWS